MNKDIIEEKYVPERIETKWQKVWQKENLWPAVDSDSREKYYLLVEFPYPSGAGLHVGHVRSYASMDALARYKRMKGLNVLYPMGWDAFGLPAENYALKMGVHPSKTVAENINRFRKQCRQLGLSFDWPREINTTDPNYYRWTQWIFLKLLEKGLAYRQAVTINWCPACKTNLADEEVLADGTHERCGQATERRAQAQWLLKITAYADRLLADLNLVDYSPKIRVQQENWIGRKEWIDITYKVDGTEENIVVSTTRPETNFGATFIVTAPEHPLIERITKGHLRGVRHSQTWLGRLTSRMDSSKVGESRINEIRIYVEQAKKKSELERITEGRAKTGVFTGLYAVNRLNNQKIPIYITDFVLMNVGTGAVVGVPGHDIRDFEFAESFNLPVIRVVSGPNGANSAVTRRDQVFEGDGVVVNSDFLNGLKTPAALAKIMDYLEEKGWGKRVIRYHLRDWVFSRQHYWGEPIPVVYCQNCAKVKKGVSLKRRLLYKTDINGEKYAIVPVPEEQLPVELPYVERYEPSGTGESPLAKMSDWVNTTCPNCSGPAKRETDTMPNWAGSNWYYLGYLFADGLGTWSTEHEAQNNKKSVILGRPDPRVGTTPESKTDSGQARMTMNTNVFSDNENRLKYWMPVDLYQGGFEHTTLHLLYSRFIYKFLYDLGLVPTPEPYARRHSHGIVLGADGRKMSKSFGNVVNPEEIITKYGADALRLYEMFIGPFDQAVAWSDESLAGCRRFLDRVWRLSRENPNDVVTPPELKRKFHRTVKKVTSDIESLKFNTAVAAFMEFINDWSAAIGAGGGLSGEDLGLFLRLLAPFAPHFAEELWQSSNDSGSRGCPAETPGVYTSVHQQPWPAFDPNLITDEVVTIVIQVNGKKRTTLELPPAEADFADEAVKNRTLDKINKISTLSPYLEKGIRQTIFVPRRLINLVV